MDTTTIIYLVAAALILRVIIKVVARYMKEHKNVDNTEQYYLIFRQIRNLSFPSSEGIKGWVKTQTNDKIIQTY